jgi:hypothetical protein
MAQGKPDGGEAPATGVDSRPCRSCNTIRLVSTRQPCFGAHPQGRSRARPRGQALGAARRGTALVVDPGDTGEMAGNVVGDRLSDVRLRKPALVEVRDEAHPSGTQRMPSELLRSPQRYNLARVPLHKRTHVRTPKLKRLPLFGSVGRSIVDAGNTALVP